MELKEHSELFYEVEVLKEKLAQKERQINKLKMDNLFLGTLFDGINEEIMILTPDFVIKDVNRAFLKRYGLKKPDAIGRKCYEIKERYRAPCNSREEHCPLIAARESGERAQINHQHKGALGEIREHSLIIYPLKLRGKKARYFLEIARDISENRALIKRLQASEKRMRAILDTATDAILSIDENHHIILFNNAAERIFGYPREEVLGENLNILVPPKYGNHEEFVHRFLEQRESDLIGKTLSVTGLRKGGEEFPIDLSLSFLEMDGHITFTGIIRDISDHQKLERKLLQSERLAAVGQAVARVAHDIKNPLMIIGGFSNQIKKCLSDPKDSQKMGMILEEVERLERLVANLGDFTKEYRLVKRSANINDVVKDVLEIMTGIYSHEKYQFNEFLSHQTPEILCDPDKLKQVFINILSNGLEAMAGGGTISISTRAIARGVEIRISDEGVGIPEADLQNIFEPFYTTRERGSGLGLSISYKIIEAHKGEIYAVSRPGQGTHFIIRLPDK